MNPCGEIKLELSDLEKKKKEKKEDVKSNLNFI